MQVPAALSAGALRRPSSLLAVFSKARFGAKIYAGFCLVLLLLVMISVASWLGFQETSDGMATSQQSSDAAITTAVSEAATSAMAVRWTLRRRPRPPGLGFIGDS